MSSTRTLPSDLFRWWLKPLRAGTAQYQTYLRLLRKKLEQEGFTLEDIGTSEEELSMLRSRGAAKAASLMLADQVRSQN